jgi:homoserine dehydrogenase
MNAPLKVGLLGLGTVGLGMIKVLALNGGEIKRRLGREIVVTDASARDLARPRNVDLGGIRLHADPMAVVNAEVDVIVELIGGISPARELVLAALERGKPVVTANKALLAERGAEIFAAAKRCGVQLAYEAAVGGGIPIIKTLREGLAANVIDSVAGIINGTSNYILTQMAVRGQGFADALADAQKLGYAEADPTFDVEGVDAAHKLSILAAIAFGIPLRFDAVATEGIGQVTAEDIRLAHELGYRIKPLGLAKRAADGFELRVHPTLVPADHLLAKTDGALNAIRVLGNAVGQTLYVGRGAGGEATASAVIADLVDVARLQGLDHSRLVPQLGYAEAAGGEVRVLRFAEIESAYYLRMRVADEPGVLRAITSILAEFDISIEAILQKEPRDHDDALLAIITAPVPEHRCDAALARMLQLPFVRTGASRLRVEHFE